MIVLLFCDALSFRRARGLVLCLLAVLGLGVCSHSCVLGYPIETQIAQTRLEGQVIDAVKALPHEATLFTFGMWKAPYLSVFSDRQMEDLTTWPAEKVERLDKKYLVLDVYGLLVRPSVIEAVATRYHLEPVFRNSRGAVFEIRPLRPYPD